MSHRHKSGKIRRVLKGAAKFFGYSLNNALLNGPELPQNLMRVFNRFRQYEYAVSVDIERMYLQVNWIFLQKTVSSFFCGGGTQLTNILCTSRCVPFSKQKILRTCANHAVEWKARDLGKALAEGKFAHKVPQ